VQLHDFSKTHAAAILQHEATFARVTLQRAHCASAGSPSARHSEDTRSFSQGAPCKLRRRFWNEFHESR
jgi:hypothetical protein